MKEYIYGRNTCKDALITREIKKAYFSSTFSDKKFIDECKRNNVDVSCVTNEFLSSLVKGNHQGVIFEVDRFEYSSLDEIIHLTKNDSKCIVLILDEINDPGNFGAIIRSVDAFGVKGIIIKKHNQVLVNPTVAKTSTGAINHVKIAQVANLSQAMEKLKENGFWIVGTDGMANVYHDTLKYDFKTAVIIGSEGHGVSPLLLRRCDHVVKIKMVGHVNSLNASVATGIMLSTILDKQDN